MRVLQAARQLKIPYIPIKDQQVFVSVLQELDRVVDVRGLSNGELNYLITKLGLTYLGKHGKSYNTISDVVKAMECAKLEFYRRVAVPYEEKKIQEYGDVFP